MNSSLYQEGLEEKVERLEKENEYLKSLLEKYQIEFDPLPFIHDEKITEVHVRFFYSMFRGRSDVYAKRSGKPNSKTGKAGYYPQCANFGKMAIVRANRECRFHARSAITGNIFR